MQMRPVMARWTLTSSSTLGPGDTATGHVVLDLAADKGVASFSGGTGKFIGFQAHADVSTDSDGLWHWEGTYSSTSRSSPAHPPLREP